jgi:hypothetical protein
VNCPRYPHSVKNYGDFFGILTTWKRRNSVLYARNLWRNTVTSKMGKIKLCCGVLVRIHGRIPNIRMWLILIPQKGGGVLNLGI